MIRFVDLHPGPAYSPVSHLTCMHLADAFIKSGLQRGIKAFCHRANNIYDITRLRSKPKEKENADFCFLNHAWVQ